MWQREIEVFEFSCKIGFELIGGAAQGGGFPAPLGALRAYFDADQHIGIAFDADRADGRCDQGMVARIHTNSVGQGERPAQAEKSL